MISTLRRQWGGMAFLLILFAIMAAWTWTRSGDPFLDAAKDLYTAQQMSNGRGIYSELCYLFGPLAPSILAGAFELFGASVHVERALNLVLFVPVILVLHRLLMTLSDRFAGTIACGVYVLLFAFGHLTPLRNYNILTPYTNSATYGLALGIMMVAAIAAYARDGRIRWLAIGGAACGLSFLTKAEIFFSCFITLNFGLGISIYARRTPIRLSMNAIGTCLLFLFITPLLVMFSLTMQSSLADVVSGTLAGYRMALDPRLHEMRFQLESAGLRFWRQGIQTAGFWLCAYAWLLLPALLAALKSDRFARRARWIGAVFAVVAFAVVVWVPRADDWADIFSGAPLVIAMAIVLLGWEFVRARRTSSPDAPVVAGRLIFSVFSLLMLARMILNARIYQYGFVLAAPAMMVVVMAWLSWTPAHLDRIGRSGWIFKATSLGMIAGFVLVHLMITQSVLSKPMIDMGGGFRASGKAAEYLKAATAELQSLAKPGDTMAAFPSAPWVNFISNLPNSTPYELLDPLGFIRAGGEVAVHEAFRSSPPAWIMLVHQDTSEYGARFFGKDFAIGLGKWIDANYEQVALYGAPPFETREFGIAVLRRREAQLSP